MLIPPQEIVRSIETENPWWRTRSISKRFDDLPRRAYFEPFSQLALNTGVNRAVILMGPRRVGKTVMTQQLVQAIIDSGVDPLNILYASIDTPTYTGLRLQYFVEVLESRSQKDTGFLYVIFDEIQYLADWERDLKVLVDRHESIRFIASGSAAAALRLASTESGAGRFTDFMLPPLTFAEYIKFIGREDLISESIDGKYFGTGDIESLNNEFINYTNYGGYPEAVMSATVRSDAARFIKNDIVDKVLLRDLPQLYGITNIQELNKLFTALAYLSGKETSFQNLSQSSNGITKPTIERYIEYLEAAFLIFRVRRVDENAKKFTRERSFKVYLTNPSMRAALFSPLQGSSEGFGHIAETAVFSQWFHSPGLSELHYARWRARKVDEEIDIVCLRSDFSPAWAAEVKWSDSTREHETAAHRLAGFLPSSANGIITTKSKFGKITIGDNEFSLVPTSIYCYTVGTNTVLNRGMASVRFNDTSYNDVF